MGGGAPSVQAPPPPNAGVEMGQAIQGYVQNAPQLYQEESQYQPQYNQMQQQMEQGNISSYAQQYFGMMPQAQTAANQVQQQASGAALTNMQMLGGQTTQALMQSSPQYGQLANLGTQQMGAGLDPTLTGLQGNAPITFP